MYRRPLFFASESTWVTLIAVSKMVMQTVVAVVLLSAGLAYSQTPSDQTLYLRNGKFWSSLPTETQSIFLMGVVDGWKLRGDTEELVRGKVALALVPGGNVSYGEMARMVTTAYADPINMSLPIGWVLMAELAVQRGEATNEAVLAALRRHLEDGQVEAPGVSPLDAILNVLNAPN